MAKNTGDLSHLALVKTDNFPIAHVGEVHSGKVRSVYWLSKRDSRNIIDKMGYADTRNVWPLSRLGVMIISDKISAFEQNWKSEQGLMGVPGKGAALNAISKYWFDQFEAQGLAPNHIVDTPHPLVWVVQQAEPVMVEAIARAYITGSMWRGYKKGEREICGIPIPDGLTEHQRLDELLLTPSTKGVMNGLKGVPAKDDVNITRDQVLQYWDRFGLRCPQDLETFETMERDGYVLITDDLHGKGQIFVDTKFEMGYLFDARGVPHLGYMDEVGTPDSSRMWDREKYEADGTVVEGSKEYFRQELIDNAPGSDCLTDKSRMDERRELAASYRVPVATMMETGRIYTDMSELITGQPIPEMGNVRAEILDSLRDMDIILD